MNAYNFTARFTSDANTELVSTTLSDCIKEAKRWAKEQKHSSEVIQIFDQTNTCIQAFEYNPAKFSNGRFFKKI